MCESSFNLSLFVLFEIRHCIFNSAKFMCTLSPLSYTTACNLTEVGLHCPLFPLISLHSLTRCDLCLSQSRTIFLVYSIPVPGCRFYYKYFLFVYRGILVGTGA